MQKRAQTGLSAPPIAGVLTVINIVLLFVNLKKTPGNLWVKWVLLDWGVGLATHAWIVFRTNRSKAAG
ncbi:MAG: 2TM domain-containing protein [Thermomicrobiales bacterium]